MTQRLDPYRGADGARGNGTSHRRRRKGARPECEPLEGRALCSVAEASLVGASATAEVADRAERIRARREAAEAARADRLASRVGPIARPGVGRQGPANRPGAGGGPVIRNVVYRTDGDRPERLDIYLPKGPAPSGGWPVVVAVHGGGWRRFSKEQYGPKVAPLTASGFAVVSPSYTLSGPRRPSWPENFEDVREAVRWVRRNADRFGFDADRVASIGESSGGHLAAMLGAADDARGPDGVSSRVDAVVDFYGPADLAALVSDSGGGPAAVQLIGGRPEALPRAYAEASPASLASPDDAPILIIHGTADPVVSLRQSQRLASAMEAAGVPTRLVVLPGAGHGFGLFDASGGLSGEVIRFLRTFA